MQSEKATPSSASKNKKPIKKNKPKKIKKAFLIPVSIKPDLKNANKVLTPMKYRLYFNGNAITLSEPDRNQVTEASRRKAFNLIFQHFDKHLRGIPKNFSFSASSLAGNPELCKLLGLRISQYLPDLQGLKLNISDLKSLNVLCVHLVPALTNLKYFEIFSLAIPFSVYEIEMECRFQNLQHLRIERLTFHQVDDKIFQTFGREISRNFLNLTHCFMKIYCTRAILKEHSLQTLGSLIFSKSRNLKALNLLFDQPYKLTNTGIKILDVISLKSLSSVQNTLIEIRNKPGTDTGFAVTAKEHTNDLVLRYSHCNIFDDPEILVLTNYMSKYLSHVKQFKFVIEGPDEITFQQIVLLSSGSAKLDPSTAGVSFEIKLLTKMEKDYNRFVFERNQIEQEICFKATKAYRTNDQNLKKLVEALNAYHLPLTKVKLQIDDCYHLGPNEFNKDPLDIGLETLSSLKHLAIILPNYQSIADESLKMFSFNILQSLVNLNSLHFEVQGAVKVTDEGVIQFLMNIVQLQNQFEYLHLSFQGCLGLRGHCLKVLTKQILTKLGGSTEIVLNFSNCQQITEKELKVLVSDILEEKPVLKKTKIIFEGCYRVPIDFRIQFREELCPVPNLEFIL